MADPWFDDINWSNLRKKQVKPPFKPKILGDAWVRYFSQEFVEEEAVDSLVESNLTLHQKQENHIDEFTYEPDDTILQTKDIDENFNYLSKTHNKEGTLVWEIE